MFPPSQAQDAIFVLYLLGIFVAVASAWILSRWLFSDEIAANISEIPACHKPSCSKVFIQIWHRLSSFTWHASKRIVAVVLVINAVSSLGGEDRWGNQNTEKSALSSVGEAIP